MRGLDARGASVDVGGRGGGRIRGEPTLPDETYPFGMSARDGYRHTDHGLNGFVDTAIDAQSTFAVDVDTASYALVRRMLRERTRPTPEAVRAEELINAFDYDYREPHSGTLAVHLEAAPSPYSKKTHLLRVGVQARRVPTADRKPTHLTFLVDVSCSMSSDDRLPLVKESLHVLVRSLRPQDTVALVTYAGDVRRILPHTPVAERHRIADAINSLHPGGSTAMGSGISIAYEEALAVLRPGHISRVVVLSDGDANVGATSHDEILWRIAGHVRKGVTLTTIGYGMGNYRDDLMEQLANKGNGNAYYVDSFAEARRLFERKIGGMLEVVAKDVKLQVIFDPRQVRHYRLVGYENRDVADRSFRDDSVDGGEIGSGHSVTALYEVTLAENAGEGLVRVHVRAKRPEGERAEEAVFAFEPSALVSRFEDASTDFQLAAAVMGFAERLRGSPWAARWSLPLAHELALRSAADTGSHRQDEDHAERLMQRRELAQLIRRFDDIELGRRVD